MKLKINSTSLAIYIAIFALILSGTTIFLSLDVIPKYLTILYVERNVLVTEKVMNLSENISKECQNFYYEKYENNTPVFLKKLIDSCEVNKIWEISYGLIEYDTKTKTINGKRTVDKILDDGRAVCLDQAIVACSLAKALNFTCYLALTETHAFPIINIGTKDGYYPLNMLLNKTVVIKKV